MNAITPKCLTIKKDPSGQMFSYGVFKELYKIKKKKYTKNLLESLKTKLKVIFPGFIGPVEANHCCFFF